jgi:hypothetical protein
MRAPTPIQLEFALLIGLIGFAIAAGVRAALLS